ncbi:PfkB family carbohydrate kinase [Nocardia sp. CDC153]|uniref:PfkB family carbohydrate kinase n=1 Tax=Nocardia sp. CDC153 TaxID=3112167 RepID=UPI002DBAD61A|nr:PfkB family carbohydrate kinase [Nocardia sp. CDC153]MEC3955508.1 PfkB family carbohydrate kinase [Nocardia sp. CDC153]
MGNPSAVFVGLTTLDLSYAVDRYPVEDSKTRADGLFVGAGGPAANAAITHAFLSHRDTTLVTALGRHALAQPIRADLTEQGVGLWDETPEDSARPPVSSIIVATDTGSRTIVSMDDSERDPQPPNAARYLDGSDVVLVDGHYPNLAFQAAECAPDGVPVVLDGGRWREEVHRKLLPDITIAICSETFAPPELRSGGLDEVIDFLHAAGPRLVAITRGDRPIRYSTPAGRGEISVSTDAVVDTLGAGDILHGAFCHYFASGSDFPSALEQAAEVATFACRFVGTREWMRHYDSR